MLKVILYKLLPYLYVIKTCTLYCNIVYVLFCRALIRPGRFDTKINVPMPDVKARHDILKVHLKNIEVSEGKPRQYKPLCRHLRSFRR